MEVLAPPPTDPLIRKEPPFDWYRTPDETRPRVETASSLPDLDPDVALWPVTPVNRWPFTGAPTEGIYPLGWIGIDNTGTAYVCTVGGEPGTWAAVGSGGGGGWPTVNGTGAGHLTAQTLIADTVGYSMRDEGSGGITIEEGGTGGITVFTSNAGADGITIHDESAAGLLLEATGGGGVTIMNSGASAGVIIQTTGGGASTGIALTTQATDTAGITLTDAGAGGITLNEAGTGAVLIETSGGGVSLGITLTTQATDTAGITLADSGPGGITLTEPGSGGIAVLSSSGLTLRETGGGGISLDEHAAGNIAIQTTGGGASTGVLIATQASDTAGIVLTDNSSHGIHVNGSGSGSVFVTTANAIHLDGGFLGFFSHTPFTQQTVTGALSTVVDPAAAAVLTSILHALATSYGLVVDGTT